MKTVLLGILCCFISHADGYNILVMMPFPTFSHTNAFVPVLTELARRGHNVTMVSPYPQKEPVPNFKDVVITNTLQSVMGNGSSSTSDIRTFNLFITLVGLWPVCTKFLDPVFELPEFQEFLNDKDSKYDLIILEVFFCQQPFLAFGHKYGAPVVTMVAPALGASISKQSGNSNPFAYVPSPRSALSDHMTFWERVKNTLINIMEIIADEFYGYPLMDRYMRTNFAPYPGFENLPTVTEMQRNISLFMVDNHFSLSYPRPYLPNVVEFGGLSAKKGGKLPVDLDQFMNESPEGVIFFTWGSHYKMTNMKPELLAAFMSVFGKLKQRVLMKWDNDTLPGKPNNVKIDRWFPQSSVLSHPKVRLFITHGGVHGVTEGIYNAVPLLGTPLFGDQHFNLLIAERAGLAINVDIDTVTEEQLYSVIKKLLDDPKFKENAKKRSLIMKDRPISALDNAVYWIEYVLRHNGARHLRPGSLDLAWYQNMLLDVVAFLLLVLILIFMVTVFTIKFLLKLLRRRKTQKKDKKEGKTNEKVKKSKKE